MRIGALDHVALHVADVEASTAFYTTALGLAPLPRPAFGFPGAWLALGGGHQLHLIGGRREPVHSGSRSTHFALRVDDLDAWAEHLRALGASFRGPHTRPDGCRQLFVVDPDGHHVELNTPAADRSG